MRFNIGDDAYIISIANFNMNREDKKGSITIQKFKVLDVFETKVKLNSTPAMMVNEWAVGQTVEEARKMGLTYIINKLEFKKDINNFRIKDYEYLEENYSDLIFKYIGKVG